MNENVFRRQSRVSGYGQTRRTYLVFTSLQLKHVLGEGRVWSECEPATSACGVVVQK